ncbi:MAG: 4-(cytidine 5'-diphospho)-2-C-methyl-D-erythritol kinase [Limnochordia bacterium]
MDEICLKAYAKINLTLDVVGRRADGYHLLQSVMQSIALCDLVKIRKGNGLRLAVDHPGVPADVHNTAWRAAELFLKRTGIQGGVEIDIDKQIPVAAGLGGGSADAAAVLVGLDRLYGTGLTPEELGDMAVAVGADVPFCLQGGTQLAEGIGEQLTPLPPVPGGWLVLVKPPVEVSTAQVYQKLKPGTFGTGSSQAFIDALVQGAPWARLAEKLGNVLESVTEELLPEVRLWKGRLLDGGALGTIMSGSGPTVVGIFPTLSEAQHFQGRWQGQAGIILTQPVGQGIGEANGGDR